MAGDAAAPCGERLRLAAAHRDRQAVTPVLLPRENDAERSSRPDSSDRPRAARGADVRDLRSGVPDSREPRAPVRDLLPYLLNRPPQAGDAPRCPLANMRPLQCRVYDEPVASQGTEDRRVLLKLLPPRSLERPGRAPPEPRTAGRVGRSSALLTRSLTRTASSAASTAHVCACGAMTTTASGEPSGTLQPDSKAGYSTRWTPRASSTRNSATSADTCPMRCSQTMR